MATMDLRLLTFKTSFLLAIASARRVSKLSALRCDPPYLQFYKDKRNLLEEDSDEEEDFFLRGPSGPRFGPKNEKIRHVQYQVDEVIDVMQENITKVIERGERLDDLQDKSESLSDNATVFSNRSKQLRRQMWWRGCKIKIIVALVVVVVLLVIIVPFILKYHT
ncbi:hypothetical protein JRQ81_014933 [Phrynocephalus forsythii]|uniref:V-SNARE coiled-coil homology domain-containing protein n=1 Tax=Phrynocephalus forsythii TaxID=171643 RepID=A0A9Q0Y086_9SAUR|nr:hypothetical protein JRQ81_014933 [Phrynocephalus forsythii]